MKTYSIVIFSLIMLVTGCALQKDVYRMEDRVEALERRNQDLEKRNKALRDQIKQDSDKSREKVEAKLQNRESEEQRMRAQYAGLNATLEKFSDDVNRLNGRIEESEYFIKQDFQSLQESQNASVEQLTQMRKDLDDALKRVSQLESYLNLEKKTAAAAAAGAAAGAAAAGTKKTAKKSENEIYAGAKQAFDAADYDAARNGFEELIKTYPKSANADNAQFWMGEIYYKEKWYEKAILEYQKVIEKYPKGNKVPAALLKQGMAFQQIGDSANSRLILKELEKKYPNTSEGKIASQKLKESN